MSEGRLIIVCGLPGAGKTTLARQLAVDLAGVRLCPDEWMIEIGISLFDSDTRDRIEGLQWQIGQEVLAGGGVVIIEWGTWGRAERDALRDRARELGAAVELRWLDVAVGELWRRVEARAMEQADGSRALTEADIAESAASFQAPTSAELATYDAPAGP